MKAKHIFYLFLFLTGTACTDSNSLSLPDPDSRTTYVTTSAAETDDYSLYIFKQQGADFLFEKEVSSTQTRNGQLGIPLAMGNYQFLFARSFGKNTTLIPALENGRTVLADLRFQVRTTENGLLPADELFLPAQGADSVYSISQNTTVRCTLKRAVSQILVQVKRGYKNDDNSFVPHPFSEGKNLTQQFSRLELHLKGIGNSIDATGNSYGNDNLTLTFNTAKADSILPDGFLNFTGPFFFPPEAGIATEIQLTLLPPNQDPQHTLKMNVQTQAHKNEQILVTAWITSNWYPLGVTVDKQPIRTELPGEEGIWDDVVKQ